MVRRQAKEEVVAERAGRVNVEITEEDRERLRGGLP
jgi:hypothetical protein